MTPDAAPDRSELLDVLGALPNLVILIDEDRTIRYINRTEEGFEPEEVVGASALDFVRADFVEAQAQLFDRVFETGEPERFEIPVTDPEGETEWYEGTVTPVREDERVTGVVVTTTNVTARHVAQEEVRRLESLVPVCSWCRKIRSDEGYWEELEAYIEALGDRRVTHGICPDCEDEIAGNGLENSA